MALINGVLCDELTKDFEEGIGSKGPYATKAYLCDWNQRYTVANAMLGLVSHSGTSIGFTGPMVYPESSNMFAREVRILPVGPQSQGPKQIQWTQAIVEAKFGIWEQSNANDNGQNSFDQNQPLVYATQEYDFGGQFITIPRSQLKTLAGGNLDQDFGRIVGVVTYTLTLHKMPFLIGVGARSIVGCINNSTFFGCAPGTLRFDGVKTRRTFDTSGTITQETTLQFAWRPEAEWDKIFTAGGWTEVITTSGGGVIVSADFTALIPSAYYG
jgi:hypothetical protein